MSICTTKCLYLLISLPFGVIYSDGSLDQFLPIQQKMVIQIIIRKGQAVVVNAEEIIDIVEEEGAQKAAEKVDVVTTGTFGPMCSSGVFLNIPHTTPKIRIQKAWVNNVSAYAGIAAVDFFLGATEIPENDPANQIFPGEFRYGGGHVIEDLIAGKEAFLRAISYGTDCYPRKEYEAWINIKKLRSATLMNPRNCYQNYNAAVNRDAKRTIYTYLGVLRPNMGNVNYCSAGQLSPLLNDPYYKTIGILENLNIPKTVSRHLLLF